MRKLKNILTLLVAFGLPKIVKPALLNLLGHKIAKSARIGPCLVWRTKLYMGPNTSIGPLNIFTLKRVSMRPGAYFGAMNRLTGPYAIQMAADSAIGNRNNITSGPGEGVPRPSRLKLGTWSKITAGHRIDVSESIRFGDYCTVAGIGTQMWTHGFVHMSEGLNRAEVRGPIEIGDNVYIGSMSCFNPGIKVADGVAIGAHSSIAKDLTEAGVYVSQGLRHIKLTPEARLANLTHVDSVTGKGFYYRGSDGLDKILARESAARVKIGRIKAAQDSQ